ncbi:phosphate signaling complex protein PhoU [Phaeovibrio sulfidiphilus]|uniref:Phosphate-specific transport system accessory protein PhoU n=1 Tax=Phaeovibrio sulfidiphilus TaxID=1220600 RepID=A0A8J6YQ33_9PROT|nr:phosphate signaling complex protein PhoU [Phaeovibrio sulfidiphilus]MBE1237177.1 phosphate signaling complex protein PhoU [Phaeovibrio sulfidiphilus]
MTGNALREHIVRSYDNELRRLDERIARMGEIAINQTRDAIALMVHGDEQTIRRVFRYEEEMNELEYAINLHAVRLIALRQPMAGDLRLVVTSLKIAGMLERVGDYTANAARRAPHVLDHLPELPVAAPIERIGEKIISMLEQVMTALRDRDASRLERVREEDVEVDTLHTGLFRTLLEIMASDPSKIPACSNLMFVSKSLERIGDQATNIAEAAFYRITGRELPAERAKKDTSSSDMIEFVAQLARS